MELVRDVRIAIDVGPVPEERRDARSLIDATGLVGMTCTFIE
jgi:hypothetical protein